MKMKSSRCKFPKRYVIVLLVLIGYVNMFYLHTNLGMAVVEMTTLKNVTLEDGSTQLKADFNWNSKEKGIILSTFSYGRLLSPIGGLLSGRFGGSTIYGIGILITASVTFFSPIFLYTHFNLFVATNVILGAFEAFSYASVTQIFSRWAPPDERTKFVSFSIIGMYFGSVVSFLVSGWILKTWGWERLFYFSGTTSFIWFWVWFFIVKNDPSEDKNISEAERRYIQEKVGSTYGQEKLVYPWRRILTCMPFWVGCLAKFSVGCGYTFTAIYLPQYIKDTNDIDIKQIGYISMIPQICAIISTPLNGLLGDYIKSHKILSITNVHKLYTSIGLFTGAIVYVMVAVWPNFTANMVAISLFQFLSTFAMTDILVLFLDLAPKYASFLNSIANIFFTSSGIITPVLVGFVVTSHSVFQWNICFMTLSSVYLCTGLIYLKFGSGKLRSWANYTPNEQKTNQQGNESGTQSQ
ncbi:vesicular glutamate transporter 2-like [Planococcus citri]|uniref:vesicular glutamate transporter 2-like n=1 Tax=Planococcus citri TaxID=170843 RepID=UPI0031F9855D